MAHYRLQQLKFARSSWATSLFIALLALGLLGCSDISAPPRPDITAANGPDGDKATVFIANAGDGTVVAFDPSPNAQGNVLPLIPEGNISPSRRFPQTITEPTGIFLDKANDTLYVADANGNAILIYENASTLRPETGSPAPNRIITGSNTMLDHPYDVAFDRTRDQLYVSNRDGSAVLRFQVNCPNIAPPTNPLDGNIAPCGVLKGIETQIFFPRGIAVDSTRNVLYISNVGDDSILIYDNASTVGGPPGICFSVNHAPPLNASVCNKIPNRVIAPHSDPSPTANDLESILDIPFAIFIDETNDRLYVVNTGFNLPGILIYDRVFTDKLTGAVVPDRVWISGNMALPPECSPLPNPTPGLPFPPQCNNSQLSLPVGIDVDVTNDLMYIVNNNNTNNINLGTNANIDSTAVLVFDLDIRDSSGNKRCTTTIHICRNIPPHRRFGGDITPDATSLTNPVGIAIDPVRHAMYLTNPTANNFMTFSLDGNINPIRVNSGHRITGTNPSLEQTFLEQPSSFFYDDVLDRLFIANFNAGNRTANQQITVFDQIIGNVPVQLSGTLSVTGGSTSIDGTLTFFAQELKPGNIISVGNVLGTVAQINSETSLDLLTPYTGITNTGTSGSIVTGGKNFSNTAPSWSLQDAINITAPRGFFIDNNQLIILSTGTKNQVLIYPLSGITGFPTTSITGPTGTTIALPPPSNILTVGFTAGSNPSSMAVDAGRGLVYIADKGNDSIIVYNLNNLPAAPTIITSTEISQPSGLFIDTTRDTLYVTNPGSNNVLAFDFASAKSGNVSPDRILSTPAFSSPISPFVDTETDRLFLINAAQDAIFTFHSASTLNGLVTPERNITGTNTQLDFSNSRNTGALLFTGRGNTETLFVGQPIGLPFNGQPIGTAKDTTCDPLPDGTISIECPRGSLLIFGLEQKVAPSHIFSGGDTAIITPSAITIDTQGDILYVADQGDRTSTVGGDDAITIIAGASTLDGNAASTNFVQANLSPLLLNNPSGLFIDKTTNRLYVANSGSTEALTGTLSVINDSTVVNGTGTSFLNELNPGDIITIKKGSIVETVTVAKIKDDLNLSLVFRWTAPTLLDDPADLERPRAFHSACMPTSTCNILVFDAGLLQGTGAPPNPLQPMTDNLAMTTMDRPHGLTVGPTGTIYAANTGGDSVLIFNSDGTLKATLSGVASRISRPVDVALDASRDFLYVLNRLEQEILVFESVSLLNGNVAPDRVIFPSNMAEVLSIDSDTQMTLEADYTGTTEAGMSYAFQEAVFSETFSVPFLPGTVAATNVSPPTAQSRIITGTGTTFIGSKISFLDPDDLDALGNPITKFMNRQERLIDCQNSTPPKNVPCLTIQLGHNMLIGPSALFLDASNDIMYVTDQVANAVYIFTDASQRDGNVEIRTIGGNNTGLHQPSAITVNPQTP